MTDQEIYRIYGTEYKEMTLALLKAADLIGLVQKKAGSADPSSFRIGIKPNLVSPTPASYGATTHPELVEGIIEYLKAEGFSNLTVIEGSWVGDRTEEAYEYCGYRSLCEKTGVPFVDTQKDAWYEKDCAGLTLRLCQATEQLDFLINVPVWKGHGQTRITCALKNMKGLIPNTEKRHFHTMGLHQPIAHLSVGLRQDFILVDHICGDLELEDGGNPISTNCILAAQDPVLLDSFVCYKMGYKLEDVPYIEMAGKLGSGSTDLSTAKIVTLSDTCDAGEPMITRALDPDEREPRRSPSDTLLSVAYAICDADSCSACYASLAPAIIRIKEEGLYEQLLAKIKGKICIGQDFRGKSGSFGIGACCSQFEHNIPGCPPEEEEVYTALKRYIAGE